MNVTPAAAVRALKRAIYQPRPKSRRVEKRIVDQFHQLYYYGMEKTWKNNTFWLNVPLAKCPLDLWIYQEIICETKPDVIVETGTAYGGSALYLASICDLVKRGRVITIDVRDLAGKPEHNRIEYLVGSSIAEPLVEKVRHSIEPADRVMVILDSDHSLQHVRAELDIYSPMVTKASYLIVEDTNVNGHPVEPLYGAGPMEAVKQFLKTRKDFEVDARQEKFFMTFNPKGYLRRIN